MSHFNPIPIASSTPQPDSSSNAASREHAECAEECFGFAGHEQIDQQTLDANLIDFPTILNEAAVEELPVVPVENEQLIGAVQKLDRQETILDNPGKLLNPNVLQQPVLNTIGSAKAETASLENQPVISTTALPSGSAIKDNATGKTIAQDLSLTPINSLKISVTEKTVHTDVEITSSRTNLNSQSQAIENRLETVPSIESAATHQASDTGNSTLLDQLRQNSGLTAELAITGKKPTTIQTTAGQTTEQSIENILQANAIESGQSPNGETLFGNEQTGGELAKGSSQFQTIDDQEPASTRSEPSFRSVSQYESQSWQSTPVQPQAGEAIVSRSGAAGSAVVINETITKSVINQVTDSLVSEIKTGNQGTTRQISLQIHPAELGQLKILVGAESVNLTAQIVASEFVTSEMLIREKGQLLNALQEIGIDLPDVEISYQQSSSQQDRDDLEFQHRSNRQDNQFEKSESGNQQANSITSDRSGRTRTTTIDLVA